MENQKVAEKNEITRINAFIEINKPKDKIWEVLKDIGDIHNFHPLIKKSYSTTHLKYGVGARRSCELLPLGQMLEEVVDWDEGNSFTVSVIGGKMLPPYHFMKGKIDLTGSGDHSKVEFTFTYQLKYGLFGRMLNAILIKPQFEKGPTKYVLGLKEYVESLND